MCGKAYIANNQASKLCSDDCRREQARRRDKERREREKEATYELELKKPKSLAQMNHEARERGMTYGQYVGWLHCQKEREKRERKKNGDC